MVNKDAEPIKATRRKPWRDVVKLIRFLPQFEGKAAHARARPETRFKNFLPLADRLPLTEPRIFSLRSFSRSRCTAFGLPRVAVGTCLLSFRPGSQCSACPGGDPWHDGSPNAHVPTNQKS